jgi:hypothetical protein
MLVPPSSFGYRNALRVLTLSFEKIDSAVSRLAWGDRLGLDGGPFLKAKSMLLQTAGLRRRSLTWHRRPCVFASVNGSTYDSSWPAITAFGIFRDTERIHKIQPLHHQCSRVPIYLLARRLAAYGGNHPPQE